jgi:dihydrofolate reductase
MGLIDEYRIFINPVILGAGKPEFNGRIDKKWLTLTCVREFSSGLVMLTYQPK